MQHFMFGWNGDCAGRFHDSINIILRDFAVFYGRQSVGIQTFNVATSNANVNLFNLAIGHQFGFFDGVLNVLHGGVNIDYHAAFHAFRGALPHANNIQRA